MSFRFLFPSLVLAAFAGAPALADDTIETVTVTGDRAHLIETQPDDTALGLELPLLETPRAVTAVSDTTLDRYGITGVDTLTAITPSAYTASYYGVEGAVNLRGTLAESYFRGFKRVGESRHLLHAVGRRRRDRIGARAAVADLWSPAKSAGWSISCPRAKPPRMAMSRAKSPPPMAAIPSATPPARSACRWISVLSPAASMPMASWTIPSVIYRGIHPSHQLVELTGNFASGPWVLSSDYMYYHSNGDVQTPGWNRLTQALIDNGTYITGSNTSLSANGKPTLTFNDLGGNPYTFSPTYTPLYIASPGCGTCTDATHTLDSGLGTTYLDRRTVYIDPGRGFLQHHHPYRLCGIEPRLGRWRPHSPAGLCRYAGQ